MSQIQTRVQKRSGTRTLAELSHKMTRADFVPPAFMAAAYELLLLDPVRQELRSTQRKPDLRQKLRQQRLPAVPVMVNPGQNRLKHLHRCNRSNTPQSPARVQRQPHT